MNAKHYQQNSLVLDGLISFMFVFLSFPWGITSKRVLKSTFLKPCKPVNILVQMYDVHGF